MEFCAALYVQRVHKAFRRWASTCRCVWMWMWQHMISCWARYRGTIMSAADTPQWTYLLSTSAMNRGRGIQTSLSLSPLTSIYCTDSRWQKIFCNPRSLFNRDLQKSLAFTLDLSGMKCSLFSPEHTLAKTMTCLANNFAFSTTEQLSSTFSCRQTKHDYFDG